MSIALMTLAWQSDIAAGPKMVLLSLCDNANENGECYPSIETISKRCSMGERTVQRHIQDLQNEGYLTRQDRQGRSTLYTLNPRRIGTPANLAPPPKTTQTPANLAPTPANLAPTVPANLAPITVIEPSIEPSGNRQCARGAEIQSAIFNAVDVDKAVWQDFVALRKAKKAPLTKTAVDGIRREAEKAGLTLEAAIRVCCESGWQGFNAGWYTDRQAKGRTNSASGKHAGFDKQNYHESL